MIWELETGVLGQGSYRGQSDALFVHSAGVTGRAEGGGELRFEETFRAVVVHTLMRRSGR